MEYNIEEIAETIIKNNNYFNNHHEIWKKLNTGKEEL